MSVTVETCVGGGVLVVTGVKQSQLQVLRLKFDNNSHVTQVSQVLKKKSTQILQVQNSKKLPSSDQASQAQSQAWG